MKQIEKTVKAFNNQKVFVECYDSADEVVEVSGKRPYRNNFDQDMRKPGEVSKSWHYVDSFEEATELMKTGYQPTVEKLKKGTLKANVQGQAKRISFSNDIVGFSPIVPLALQGVPNSMQNSYMKPIKAKVLDVYYDMTASCHTKAEDIIKAGQQLLAAIMELEMQGYKFNLYAIQSYYSYGKGADILCTKIKSSNTLLDLKRISFPLTHTAYFRVIGFDWYSRCPKTTYRHAYGQALGYNFGEDAMRKGFKEIFGDNCIVFSCAKVLNESSEHFKNAIKDNSNLGKKVN